MGQHDDYSHLIINKWYRDSNGLLRRLRGRILQYYADAWYRVHIEQFYPEIDQGDDLHVCTRLDIILLGLDSINKDKGEFLEPR